MIAAGKKQGEIAKKLGVTTGTVKEWRADPKVQQMVEQSRQRMLAAADVEAKEVIGTLATQMRGSVYSTRAWRSRSTCSSWPPRMPLRALGI